jgi:hypothetical protein
VIFGSPGQGSGPQTPGFLSLPGSIFTAATDAGDGMFYDRPLKRWVPWGPQALSADGLKYAYVDGDSKSSRLHVVDLRSQLDVVVAEGGPWRVVGVQQDSVYVMRVEYLPESLAYGVMQVGRGLWKVPMNGGAPDQLTSDGRNWALVSGGFVWGDGSTFDIAGGPNDIVRVDVQTKRLTTWFAPGKRSRLLAIDAGGVPLIMSESDTNELWRVPAQDRAVKVWSAGANEMGPYYPVAVDREAVWFSSQSMSREWGLYKYSAPKGVELVARFTDHPVTVAGPCA